MNDPGLLKDKGFRLELAEHVKIISVMVQPELENCNVRVSD